MWSPHSNFELYGVTADVGAAYCEGVTLALAPDWSPTGSDNMLDEIKYAHDVNRDRLEGLFQAASLSKWLRVFLRGLLTLTTRSARSLRA